MTVLRNVVRSRAIPAQVGTPLMGWRDSLNAMLGTSTYAGRYITGDSALAVTAFYRAISIRANLAGTLPIHIYQKDQAGNRQQVEVEGDSYLWRRPNPEVSKAVFWMTFFGHLASTGNAYLYVVAKDGRPSEMYPIEPKRVELSAVDLAVFAFQWIENLQETTRTGFRFC